jgi:hypothetical protein
VRVINIKCCHEQLIATVNRPLFDVTRFDPHGTCWQIFREALSNAHITSERLRQVVGKVPGAGRSPHAKRQRSAEEPSSQPYIRNANEMVRV